jgi:hypothetical protein
MARRATVLTAALLALVLVAGRALAQETPAPEAAKPAKAEAVKPEAQGERPPTPRAERGPTATLRVQLVISRFQGDKKTGSLPYAFTVTAGSGNRARMRMGVDTPVPYSVQKEVDGVNKWVPGGVNYKNVGTNIDCSARDLGDGRYLLNISVENSSVLVDANRPAQGATTEAPLFRRFESSLDPVLRDGQTIQTVAATDPVSGEVVKIDVTLNVVR